ncbi:MAG TPA: SAM-dependent methyltransferase [Candidatus Omnitrophota bacterium]|nr:SAM-dependent methyltransferase [Candidatus Omnitrophota bacterium]HQL41063.1 SAM-dependent methyltransferase [Candidatus Omnitrophota bacterium]
MAKLYLIPTSIHDEGQSQDIPESVSRIVQGLRIFIVEEEKTARRYLKSLFKDFPLREAIFFVYNEHHLAGEALKILDEIGARDCGLLSEAGAPCVADPGNQIVLEAHRRGAEVVPLVGPSAILLALMSSGLNGQRFCFHGYLPKDKNERIRALQGLEQRSWQDRETQIFMEAPYRNESLLNDVFSFCDKDTWLCIACDLCGANQFIKTMTIERWRENMPSVDKRPTLFLLEKRKRT